MIKSVSVKTEEEYLDVILKDEQQYSYPWIWLRNNCQCSSCVYGPSNSRRGNVKDMVIDIHLDKTEVSDDGQSVKINWSDGHESLFKLDWLLHYRLTEDGIEERRNAHRLPEKLWGSEMSKNITEIDFTQLMENDQCLHQWLKALEVDGLVMLKNTPNQERKSLIAIADRVNAWLRPQNHGDNFSQKEIFSVRADMTQHSIVYSQGRLDYHTDLAFFDHPPSVGMLHCLAQTCSKGGDSLFADGFKAAVIMKELYPDYYKILTTCPVYHHDLGGYYHQFRHVGTGPIIRLDHRGELQSIVFEPHTRHCPVETKIENLKTFYKAYKMFWQVLEDNHIEYKLKSGDIACMDNTRVLHGRLAFEMQPGDVRHLEGSYLEWDELRSTRRVLDEKF